MAARSKTRFEYGADRPGPREKCPCDSGKIYVRCCAKQAIEWHKQPDGTWTRSVPIGPEARAILDAEATEFKELFGRNPRGPDLVFWRLRALSSDDEMDRQMAAALDDADMDPGVAYAIKKTGLILTKQNKHLVTGRDLADWNAAIGEYWSGEADSESDPDAEEFGRIAIRILKEYERIMLAIGSAINLGGPPRAQGREEPLMHVMFCTTRALRTLRALKLLTDEYYGEDALALVRSAYEGYLNIAYVLADTSRAEHIFWARLGIAAGTHEYARRPNGRVDWTRIIEKATGAEYLGAVTFREMARLSFRSEDFDVFEDLYSFLSTYTHPDAVNLTHYTDGRRYDHTKSSMYAEALTLGLFVGFFIVDALCTSELLSRRFQKDLERYRSRTRNILLELMSHGFSSSFASTFGKRVDIARHVRRD
jgi:hypothetical protein